MTRPDLTPAMRAALLVAARYGRTECRTSAQIEACGLLRIAGLVRWDWDRYRATPAGLDALRAEVST